MGKRHRKERRQAKLLAHRLGIRETELGELEQRLSKAEARRRFIRRHRVRQDRMWQLVDELCRRAAADIQAEEDAECLALLEECATPKSLWKRLQEQ